MNIYSFNDALLSIAYNPLHLQLSLPTIIVADNLCIKYFSFLAYFSACHLTYDYTNKNILADEKVQLRGNLKNISLNCKGYLAKLGYLKNMFQYLNVVFDFRECFCLFFLVGVNLLYLMSQQHGVINSF